MEHILMALFGGGIADWEDISKTNYDWEDIIEETKFRQIGLEFLDINDFYSIILEMAKSELVNAIDEWLENNTNTYLQEDYNGEDDFEIFANCLDSHLYFTGLDKVGEEIQKIFADKIQEINNNIGFTEIEF